MVSLLTDTTKFIKFDPKSGRQLIWDASSLDAYKRCPRYYEYSILKGYRSPSKGPMFDWGHAIHSGIEIYDRSLVSGLSWAASQEAAVEHVYQTYYNDLLLSTDSRRTLETALRAVIWYTEQFKQDDFKVAVMPDGSAAVEVRFEVPIPNTEWRLSGRVDKIAWNNNFLYIIERKTTGSTLTNMFFERFNPNTQVSAYVWAFRQLGLPISGVVIEAIQAAVGFNRIVRGTANRSESHIKEFERNMIEFLNDADESFYNGHFRMNESACFSYGGCQYREVCASPERIRQEILNDNFVQKEKQPQTVEIL